MLQEKTAFMIGRVRFAPDVFQKLVVTGKVHLRGDTSFPNATLFSLFARDIFGEMGQRTRSMIENLLLSIELRGKRAVSFSGFSIPVSEIQTHADLELQSMRFSVECLLDKMVEVDGYRHVFYTHSSPESNSPINSLSTTKEWRNLVGGSEIFKAPPERSLKTTTLHFWTVKDCQK